MNGPTSGPLGRSAWGGRLVEKIGQNSYLNGIAFGIGSKAFNDADVIASGKHFLLDEQETNRQASGDTPSYSANVNSKALHRIYMW